MANPAIRVAKPLPVALASGETIRDGMFAEEAQTAGRPRESSDQLLVEVNLQKPPVVALSILAVLLSPPAAADVVGDVHDLRYTPREPRVRPRARPIR